MHDSKGGRVVELQKMIKAVTYHNLKIQTIDGGLETTIVMDVSQVADPAHCPD